MDRGAAIDLADTDATRPMDPGRALVQRAQRGDPEAFDRLYHEHVDRVYAICLRMTADRSRAEILTQDVFVRCWERISTFRGDSLFSSWLHRLTVNLVLSDHRSRAQRALHLVQEPDLGRYGKESEMTGMDRRIDAERAIAGLPPQARHVLVLYGIEGYRYREIAELMGISIGTVKTQIHRARKLLEARLGR